MDLDGEKNNSQSLSIFYNHKLYSSTIWELEK